MMVPHGSSVYSYHFVITRHNSPFAEFLMMHPGPTEVVPMFAPQLLGEPVPVNGRIRAGELDRPGVGVELNRDITLHRPYPNRSEERRVGKGCVRKVRSRWSPGQ